MTATTSDEETPLLGPQPASKKPSPIPWRQIYLLLLLQLAEPLTSQVVYPFAPDFVRHTGITNGDEGRVGYCVGVMQSVFFATQALTVLHWSRISDVIGRKPVVLTGLVGLSLSMYCFGLSTTYWGAVFSRSLNGALNGNIGVMKSMLAEITDSSNLAQVYGFLPIAWSTGGTLGPIIGGTLARPAERFPHLFGNSEFLKTYPYFLPCAVPATFSAVAWFITFKYLKETAPYTTPIRHFFSSKRSQETLGDAGSVEVDEAEKPVPMRALLVPRVLVAAGNYASLSFVDISYRAIQPLFFSTPIELGGLGLPPPTIGLILSAFGILNGIFQVFFFARIHDRWGTKNVFIAGISSCIPVFALFPVMNVFAREQGVGHAVWAVVALQIIISLGVSLCYGCVFIYIAASAPNKASLGATNGLAQMFVSVMRTFGPAAANSLFSLSIKHQYMHGYMVYYALTALSLGALGAAASLPRKVW